MNIDKHYHKLQQFVRVIASGNCHGLVIIGEGGLGKSYQVIKTLDKEGRDYAYLTTFLTPLELYHRLYDFQSKIIVLDDCSGILNDKKNVGILKSATWSATGNRVISYFSTSEKLTAPDTFEFTGSVIILLNELPDNKDIQSLISRMIEYELKFDYQAKMEIIEEVGRKENMPEEVLAWIKENTDETTKNLNIRSLVNINKIYSFAKNDGWTGLAEELIDIDENKRLFLKILKSNKPVSEQVKDFEAEIGKRRATFFNWKKSLKV